MMQSIFCPKEPDRQWIEAARASGVPTDAAVAEARRIIGNPFRYTPGFEVGGDEAAAAARLRAAGCRKEGEELLVIAYRMLGKDPSPIAEAVLDEFLVHSFHP